MISLIKCEYWVGSGDQSCLTLCNPMGLSGSSVHGMSRQECWSGLPFPTPGDLPDPGIKPGSLVSPALAGGFPTIVPPGKPMWNSTQPYEITKYCHLQKPG